MTISRSRTAAPLAALLAAPLLLAGCAPRAPRVSGPQSATYVVGPTTAPPTPGSARAATTTTTTPQAEGGLLPVRVDAATGKVFLTVRPGEPMLYLNTLATGLGSAGAGLDRGQVGTDAVVRW